MGGSTMRLFRYSWDQQSTVAEGARRNSGKRVEWRVISAWQVRLSDDFDMTTILKLTLTVATFFLVSAQSARSQPHIQ
jgi:hypothetical protein